jgi:hypothetical protein
VKGNKIEDREERIVLREHRERSKDNILCAREYCIIYRGHGFLAVR